MNTRDFLLDRFHVDFAGNFGNAVSEFWRVRKDESFGLYSVEKDQIVIPVAYDVVDRLSESDDDLWQVILGERIGIFSIKRRKLVLPIKYREAVQLNKDLITVRELDLWGAFSVSRGFFVTQSIYDSIKIEGGELVKARTVIEMEKVPPPV